MNQELKEKLLKRVRSLAWRTGCFAVVGLIAVILDNLADFQLPPVAVAVVGLVLGELAKAVNSSVNKFGARKQ